MKISSLLIIMTTFILGSCTVHLPPSDEPIPSADPIILPSKPTTINTQQPTTKKSEPAKKPAQTAVVQKPVVPEIKQETPQSATTQGQTFYIVKPKDTVFAVMRYTGVHWKEIIRLNNLQPPKYVIHPGQRLRVK